MKRCSLLIAIAFSLSASAQVDPAFTAKMIDVVNAAKDYALASEANKPTAFEVLHESFRAIWPMTNAQFSSKTQSMLNSPEEMAKFSTPLGFIQCVASAAVEYYTCINRPVPEWPTPANSPTQCNSVFTVLVYQCAVNHL